MTAKNNMRMLTYQFSIEMDGKSVATITRATRDLDDALSRINKKVGENTTVTAKQVSSKKEAVAITRRELTESNKQIKKLDALTAEYNRQINAVKMSVKEQEVYNAQVKAGVTANSEQGESLARLVTELHNLREAKAATETAEKAKADEIAETEKLKVKIAELTKSYQQQAIASRMTTDEQEVYAAVLKLGADATEEQKREITNLVREKQKNVKIADRERNAEKASNAEKERSNKSIEGMINHYTRLNQELKREDVNMEVVNAQMRAGVTASSVHGKQIEKLVLEYQQLRNHGDKAGTSMRNFRGIMQNAGWQIQDTVVQLQMGTSAFTVLSQQGSQFASAFGRTGALIGALIAVSGVIGGTLFKSLMDAKNATEQLEAAQEVLNDLITTSTGSVGDYARSLGQLARVDAGLAKLKMTQGIVEAESAIKSMAEGLDELIGESRGRYMYELQQQLGITAEEAKALNKAQKEFNETGDITALRNVMVGLNEAYGKTNKKLNEHLGGLTDTVVKSKEYTSTITKLNAGLTNLDAVFEETTKDGKKQKDTAADLVKEWTDLTNTYNLSEVSLAKYNVRQALTESKQLDQIDTVNALIDKHYKLKKAREDDVIAAEDAAARETALSKIETGLDSGGGDPVAAEIARYKKLRDELAYLKYEYDASDTAAQAKVNDLELEAKRQHDAKLISAHTRQMTNYASMSNQTLSMMTQTANMLTSEGAKAMADQMDNMNDVQKGLFILTQITAAAMAVVNGIDLGMKLAAMTANPAMLGVGTALGAASAGAIMGTTIAGAFDQGGVIPQDQYGIVSEYGDELVDGVLVKGKQGGTRVTSREDTAKIMNQGGDAGKAGVTIVQNITVTGNGDAALSQAMRKAAKQGAKEGYSMVAQDFKTGRGIRQTLKRSARV